MSTGEAPGRVALITGANRGLGRAVAAELHARGVQIIVTARKESDATAAAAEIGPDVRAHELDVTDAASVEAAAAALGDVDIVVSNAGALFDRGDDPLQVPIDLVERTLAVNVLGAWRVGQAFLPGMVSRGWGRLVFVSSGTGSFHHGLFTGSPAYSLSKAALNGVTCLLAQAVADSGVLVNAVNPGITKTRMMPHAQRDPAEAAVGIANVATLADDGPTGAFLRGGDGARIDW
ncbi:SDR family NAD(P)-dependent oxidoreductase [Amycolatopsis ultiminotia]|uniref:SDR family NAD(P)-dependent oxidoreductase n=1 Tax=Amycolatopsis ultiminotia TaxID=543629 RepID=A0ABP6XN15_9PSEU